MKLLFSLLLCISCTVVFAQSFEELIRKGDKLYSEEKYAESAQEFDKAFALQEGNSSQYYNAACSQALAGNQEAALKLLDLSVDKGWKNLKHLKRDTDLSSLHEAEAWTSILSKVQANLDEYEKDFDKPLKEQLEAIYVKDQTLRQLLSGAEEKFGQDSEEIKYLWDLINEQDRQNEEEVISIIDKHGWVGRSLVGGQANTTVWLVIQHASLELQEKYLPMMKESVMKGESRGSQLALLEDRILMRREKPQMYGSQITTDKETGKQIVYEIQDPEYVNQRRKEVGLGPIQDYVSRWGIEWTIEQKER